MRLALLLAAALTATSLNASAQAPRFSLMRIATPDQRDAVPLYSPGTLRPTASEERWGRMTAERGDGGSSVDRTVRNVTVPTLTPILPERGKATGAAVLVAPGGAFMTLSIDGEGFDVARELARRGIAAFVLKYRTNTVADDEQAFMSQIGQVMGRAIASGGTAEITDPYAGPDALQALRLIRAHAAEWRIDPRRLGMIGFSAGAMTTLLAVTTGTSADRPAFFGYIYGPMTAIAVPDGAPPMFAALAMDDMLFGRQGFGIVEAWHKAGRAVELHAYQQGDHGFGLGRPGTTTMLLLPEFVEWIKMNRYLDPS